MGDWSYVVLAYAVTWGAVAAYTLVLQRRIARARAAYFRNRQYRLARTAAASLRRSRPAPDIDADWLSHGRLSVIERSEYLERVRAELAADTRGEVEAGAEVR